MKNALVIGAGLSGCVSANLLKDFGYYVVMIEAQKEIGGLCIDMLNSDLNVLIQPIGPRVFQLTDSRIVDFIQRFSPFKKINFTASSFINGKHIPFPLSQTSIKMMYDKHLETKDEFESYVSSLETKDETKDEINSYESYMISNIGEKIYEDFFKHYTIKCWGTTNIPYRVGKKFKPIRYSETDHYCDDDVFCGVPDCGFTDFLKRMIDHKNIEVILNKKSDFDLIRKSKDRFDLVVNTGRLDSLFDFKFGRLSYLTRKSEIKIVEDDFQPTCFVNYPSPDIKLIRTTDFKKIYGVENSSKNTAILFEYESYINNDPNQLDYYPCFDDNDLHLFDLYLTEAKKYGIINLGRTAQYKYLSMEPCIKSVLEILPHFV